MLIKFSHASLKKFYCCSKFPNSLTQRCNTKLSAAVSNEEYFESIILKFKTLIYNSNSKRMNNFCTHGCNASTIDGKIILARVFRERKLQNTHN